MQLAFMLLVFGTLAFVCEIEILASASGLRSTTGPPWSQVRGRIEQNAWVALHVSRQSVYWRVFRLRVKSH